jgi:hypothetical protein
MPIGENKDYDKARKDIQRWGRGKTDIREQETTEKAFHIRRNSKVKKLTDCEGKCL